MRRLHNVHRSGAHDDIWLVHGEDAVNADRQVGSSQLGFLRSFASAGFDRTTLTDMWPPRCSDAHAATVSSENATVPP